MTQPRGSLLTPEAMELLFNPEITLNLLRQRAEKAYRQLTGRNKIPGERELRNTWLSGLEYSAVNMQEQISRLQAYGSISPEYVTVLRRTYSRERRLGEQIRIYLTELTHDEPDEYITAERRYFAGVKTVRQDTRRDQGTAQGAVPNQRGKHAVPAPSEQ